MTERPACTVSQLNGIIKGLLDTDPRLLRVSVMGELSNYKLYPSGHHYFSLKDANSSLRCVMFRSDAGKLRFRPENGMKVICTGRVGVYERDGAYQLYVGSLMPDGAGDLHVAFEQMKARLAEEGLFDAEHKKPLPAFPERIAVITSGAGAAVRDIIRILGQRWPQAKVLVLPVRVQGAEAPAEIAGAIRYANRWQVADIIITGRGGGSMEDLWAFNDEGVARAIYESRLPVISAVGHEPDVTIADYVADVRASTPSNGAELAVRDREELHLLLVEEQKRMDRAVCECIQNERHRLTSLSSRPILENPLRYVQNRAQELDRLSERFYSAGRGAITEHKQAVLRNAATLEALSPLKVLTRGYAVVTDEYDRVLTDAAAVQVGASLNVKLSSGTLRCRVEEKMEGLT